MASAGTKLSRYMSNYRRIITVMLIVLIIWLHVYRMRTSDSRENKLLETAASEQEIQDVNKQVKTVIVDGDKVDDDETENYNAYEFDDTELVKHLEEFESYLDSVKVDNIAEDMLQPSSCPACFGKDLCDDALNGNIQVESEGLQYGRWGHRYVFLKKAPLATDLQGLDDYICKGLSKPNGCDVGQGVISEDSFILKEDAFLLKNLKLAHEAARPGSSDDLSFPACASKALIAELSSVFDADKDNKLSKEDTASFWFTAVSDPQPLMSQFLTTKFESVVPLVEHYGSCGRVQVLEAAGRGLGAYLDEDWHFRADAAYQLLSIVELLLYGDANWVVIWSRIMYENLVVNLSGDLIVSNTEGMFIVAKKKPEDQQLEDTVCNWDDCILPQTKTLQSADNDCSEVEVEIYAGHVMYLATCQLLSGHPEHRLVGHAAATLKDAKGLLHGAPENLQGDIAQYLDECVTETKPRGRFEAIDGLTELLAPFSYHYYDDYSEESEEHEN